MNEKVKTVLTKGIPLAVGACAGTVIERLIGAHIPEQTKITKKIVQKVGIWGISTAMSAAVMTQVEKEVADALDIAEPVIDLFDHSQANDVPAVTIVEEEDANGGSTEA